MNKKALKKATKTLEKKHSIKVHLQLNHFDTHDNIKPTAATCVKTQVLYLQHGLKSLSKMLEKKYIQCSLFVDYVLSLKS